MKELNDNQLMKVNGGFFWFALIGVVIAGTTARVIGNAVLTAIPTAFAGFGVH